MFNFSPMFKFDEERDEYVAQLNGVEFVCDEPQDSYKKEAKRLSKLYFEKLPDHSITRISLALV